MDDNTPNFGKALAWIEDACDPYEELDDIGWALADALRSLTPIEKRLIDFAILDAFPKVVGIRLTNEVELDGDFPPSYVAQMREAGDDRTGIAEDFPDGVSDNPGPMFGVDEDDGLDDDLKEHEEWPDDMGQTRSQEV